MSTVAFASEADYQTWHDGKCSELDIPHPGYNQESGDPAIVAQWTTAYAAPRIVDGSWSVTLSDDLIAADPFLSTLPVLEIRYPFPDRESQVDENGNPISVIETVPPEQYEKSLPDTWTYPETGEVYNTSDGKKIS